MDEDALSHFVPADLGQSGHEVILRDFSQDSAGVGKEAAPPRHAGRVSRPGTARKRRRTVRRIQRPDGMGVALRGLCRVLDYVGIDYHLRDFADIKAVGHS